MRTSTAEAKIDLVILNSEALEVDQSDLVTRLVNAGLPMEVVTRIENLWDLTKHVAGQVVHIGKIIITEILKFIELNPNLSAGVAVGAAIGALVGMVPWVGPLLAPLAACVGIIIGSVAGYKLDLQEFENQREISYMRAAIAVARKFFVLFANILNQLKAHFTGEN